MNSAARQHLIAGRDIVWTTGPLAYLTAPLDIGNNLVKGLLFQSGLWLLVLIVIGDLFFRSGLPLRNLAFFSAFMGMAGRLFQYPQPLGCGDLLLATSLILLVQFHLRGGLVRYIGALAMLGFIPLVKFVGLMTLAAVIFGLVLHWMITRKPGAIREIALAIVLPALVTGTGYWIALGSVPALEAYLRSSLEVSRGYSAAMSTSGPAIDIIVALETLILLGIVLARFVTRERAALLVAITLLPLAISFKHAFVRQDLHITHFFCLAALVLALVTITASLDGPSSLKSAATVLLVFVLLWQGVMRNEFRTGIGSVTGITPMRMIWSVLRFGSLHQRLALQSDQEWPLDLRLEPAVGAVVRQDPVASLSVTYSSAPLDGLNLRLYPVVQRYSAYTPYLDQLNANWIRDRGPRFLIFDGKTIDGRHPWTETPAMWVEIYRWYDTRLLGRRMLLLERRAQPRFSRFEPVMQSRVRFGNTLQLPSSTEPIFWTMQCSLSKAGKVRELLFRLGEVTMTVAESNRAAQTFRALPAVLGAPSMGNYMPSDLAEFAAVFSDSARPGFSVKAITLGGPGSSAYLPECNVELLRPVR